MTVIQLDNGSRIVFDKFTKKRDQLRGGPNLFTVKGIASQVLVLRRAPDSSERDE